MYIRQEEVYISAAAGLASADRSAVARNDEDAFDIPRIHVHRLIS